jgi:hypothetical protein
VGHELEKGEQVRILLLKLMQKNKEETVRTFSAISMSMLTSGYL